MNKCHFCGANEKNIIKKPKIKHYEIGENGNSEIVSTSLFVIQCKKCDIRWIKYKQIKDAIDDHKHSR